MKKILLTFLFAALTSFFTMQTFAALENAVTANENIRLFNAKLFITKQKRTNLEFVQVAQSGTLEPISGSDNTYTLTLKNVSDYTSYFSDRPKRITGIISTENLFKVWNQGKDNLEKNPPNAALESHVLQSHDHINYVFEVKNPVFDKANKTVTYTATLLQNQHIDSNIKNLGYTVLFIDGFGINWNGNNS